MRDNNAIRVSADPTHTLTSLLDLQFDIGFGEFEVIEIIFCTYWDCDLRYLSLEMAYSLSDLCSDLESFPDWRGDITRGVIADDTAAEHLRGRSLQHIDGFM
ncbi:unnamed protein product, partial [Vitis vinifera]